MKIGFKNFKKFQDFPMIELAPITFLVGPNNSGKSSFIKASLLLIYNIIKNWRNLEQLDLETPGIDEFSFFNNTTTNFGWGDYTSSLNKNKNRFKDNIIFTFAIAGYEFELEYGMFDPKNSMPNPTRPWRIAICSKKDEMQFKIEYDWDCIWKCKSYEVSKNLLLNWANKKCMDIIEPFDNISNYYLHNGKPTLDLPAIVENDYQFMCQLIEKLKKDNINEIISNSVEDKILGRGTKDCVSDCIIYLKKELNNELFKALFYVETHNATHRNALDINDKNNFVAQTVFEYFEKSPLPEVNDGHKFVTKWLKEFNIGVRFLIKTDFNGEIYSVYIFKDLESYPNISNSISLGQIGTGAIQIFTMLLKLAIAIEESKKRGRILLEIEEPEQNLHPAFQSRLADVFKEAYELSNGKVHFIVETHSEYLIRRTQVMVAEEHYSDDTSLKAKNPFKVYYFPEEGLPYDMKYCVDGCFEEDFGSGFFDESIKLAYNLFKL